MAKNQGHAKPPRPGIRPDVDPKDIDVRNEARSAGLPGEEPHDIRKAGGGVVGPSQGGAHTGRYGPSPSKVVSNREPKPRGPDKHEEAD